MSTQGHKREAGEITIRLSKATADRILDALEGHLASAGWDGVLAQAVDEFHEAFSNPVRGEGERKWKALVCDCSEWVWSFDRPKDGICENCQEPVREVEVVRADEGVPADVQRNTYTQDRKPGLHTKVLADEDSQG